MEPMHMWKTHPYTVVLHHSEAPGLEVHTHLQKISNVELDLDYLMKSLSMEVQMPVRTVPYVVINMRV